MTVDIFLVSTHVKALNILASLVVIRSNAYTLFLSQLPLLYIHLLGESMNAIHIAPDVNDVDYRVFRDQ